MKCLLHIAAIAVVLTPLVLGVAACGDNSCYENGSSLPLAAFYLGEKQQTVTPTDNVTDLSTLSDADLFQHLSTIIEREQLFLESTCDRQMLTERFSLPKERIGNAFVRGGGYNNMSAYINILRLEFAAQMLTDRPDLDVSQVAQSSGFISHRYFSTCFKQRFGLSPSDYREASKSV